uniref:Uncharacterized protein n=1 Tax=Anguilla anguilla TaxID=7936 RepID=A0A0E9UAF7_ANGAN
MPQTFIQSGVHTICIFQPQVMPINIQYFKQGPTLHSAEAVIIVTFL